MAKDVRFNIKLSIDGKESVVTASANVKELAASLGIVHDRATAADRAFARWSQSVTALNALSNSVSQVAGTLNSLTQEYRSFAGAMKAANTMAGKDPAGLRELTAQVTELSKTVPIARDELAGGLYEVISNAVPEDNWISYLTASARSAVGGIADIGEVVKVTSTIIKNYGLEWSAAGDIQDKIQLTAKNGVTTFGQLAEALPSVTGQAAQLGVSLTEMLGVMSTLTGVTGNTSEVATQLASVLTALTKESSKSQKAADAMGISFNAASIKAAGGFQSFLQQLDRTVTAYAEKTGQLRETIYSQLFGRAEALRLVNALTGEMAGRFAENIEALDESAGTMDAAFGQMASTGSAATQMLRNQAAALTDMISRTISGIQPYVNFTAQAGMAVMSIASLTTSMRRLNVQQALTRVRAAGAAVSIRLQSIAARLLGVSETQAAAATGVLRTQIIATEAAITMGLSLAVAGLVEVLSRLIARSRDAREAVDAGGDAQDSYREAAARARAEIESDISALDRVIKSKGDEKKAVEEMNTRYGDLFGTYSTAADWYDTLAAKSKDYCRQLGYEALAAGYKDELAEALRKQAEAQERLDSTPETRKRTTYLGGSNYITENVTNEDWTKAKAELDSYGKEVEDLTARMQTAAGKAADLRASLKTATTGTETTETAEPGGGGDPKSLVSDIEKYRQSVERAVEVNRALGGEYTDNEARMRAMKSGITSLIREYGLEAEGVRELVDEYRNLGRTVSASVLGEPLERLPGFGAKAEGRNPSGLIDNRTDNGDNGLEKTVDLAGAAQEALGGLGEAFGSLSEIIRGNAAQWVSWVGKVLSAIGQAIPAIATLTAAKKAEATANAEAAATGAASSVASIPFVGAAMAAAAVATVVAALASIPKFAKGGLAFGPTIGMIGEYPGASNNPEVIAPLSDLRPMLSQSGDMGGRVRFTIEGRTLVGILEKESRYNSRM